MVVYFYLPRKRQPEELDVEHVPRIGEAVNWKGKKYKVGTVETAVEDFIDDNRDWPSDGTTVQIKVYLKV